MVNKGHQTVGLLLILHISRGIRQGDSLSALLYIIQFESLAQKLRTDNGIKGIDVELKNCNNILIQKVSGYE